MKSVKKHTTLWKVGNSDQDHGEKIMPSPSKLTLVSHLGLAATKKTPQEETGSMQCLKYKSACMCMYRVSFRTL